MERDKVERCDNCQSPVDPKHAVPNGDRGVFCSEDCQEEHDRAAFDESL